MRRQMQLRPSQGGKMRGLVGDTKTLHRTAQASLAQYHDAHDEEGARWLIERVKTDRPCRCGYLVCAKVGPCAPVEPEPIAEPAPEPLRYADGQEVRVGDVYSVRPDSMATYRIAAILGRCVIASSGGGRLLKSAWADAPRHLRRRAAPRIEVGMRVRVKGGAHRLGIPARAGEEFKYAAVGVLRDKNGETWLCGLHSNLEPIE